MTFADRTVFWILIVAAVSAVIFSADLSAAADGQTAVSAKDNNEVSWLDKYHNLSRENKIAFWGLSVPIAACFLVVMTGLFFPIILKMHIAKKQRLQKK